MRIRRNESKFKRIKETAIEDGINYIIGLSGVSIPWATAKELWKMRKESSPANFVDWELKDWPQIYRNEINSVVSLQYKGNDYLLPQVWIFNNVRRKLDLSQISFKLKEKPFDLRGDISALTEIPYEKLRSYLQKKRKYVNGQNLRLINIIDKKTKVELEVQPVEYKHYVHTNLVLDAKSSGKSQTLREYIHPDGNLKKLSESPLANQLGINILLFTADGSLIMQERSSKVAFYNGQLCPAASGTVSLIDVPKKEKITLEEMHEFREGWEEIGIEEKDISKDRFFFLGITRELIRGGTPEMFFCGKTDLSEKEIKERWKYARDKWESKNLIFFHFGKSAYEDLTQKGKIHKFLCKIDDFLDKYMEKSSIPLLTNLALWVKYRLKLKVK